MEIKKFYGLDLNFSYFQFQILLWVQIGCGVG